MQLHLIDKIVVAQSRAYGGGGTSPRHPPIRCRLAVRSDQLAATCREPVDHLLQKKGERRREEEEEEEVKSVAIIVLTTIDPVWR